MNLLLAHGDRIEGTEIILIEGKSIGMAKSKSSIIWSHTPHGEYPSYWHETDIEHMMDEWAKIQGIAFSDWVQENEYFIPEGYTSYVKRTGQETRFTNNQFIKPEDLFGRFLKYQSEKTNS